MCAWAILACQRILYEVSDDRFGNATPQRRLLGEGRLRADYDGAFERKIAENGGGLVNR